MDSTPQLTRLGYNQFFDSNRQKLGAKIELVARVTAEHKNSYEVASIAGEYRATVTGKRMLLAASRDDYPAVGDWVILKDDKDTNKVITDILPRKTTLHKKYSGKDESQLIAANVDVAFIVESIDRDYSLNRFERYVVLAREGGIKPVIILNKTDLSEKDGLVKNIEDIRERFGDIDVLTTSTITSSGIDDLVDFIANGKTYCFLGSSGVGKSSIINKLLQKNQIATKAIGTKTGRGKHTTTARETYFTANGGIIIDNPGSREVGVADASTGLGMVFADIASIANTCRFKDCKHANEPGCAVQLALNTNTINVSQYENYQKLQKEAEHYERSTYEKHLKDKEFGKFIKNANKDFKKYKLR
jgi:ribosome biogenesis GTPase / thiamine phosphate phosphatase